jgi:hypothetical protein
VGSVSPNVPECASVVWAQTPGDTCAHSTPRLTTFHLCDPAIRATLGTPTAAVMFCVSRSTLYIQAAR